MKNPLEEKLPIGDHNADQMAALLRFKSKKAFLQRLRELGWLIVDPRGVKYSDHNLPRTEIIKAGYAYVKTYSYGAGPGKQISREYRKAIFTQKGLDTLKGILFDGKAAPEFKPAPVKIEEPKPAPAIDKKAAERERAEAIKSLREMGIFGGP